MTQKNKKKCLPFLFFVGFILYIAYPEDNLADKNIGK